MNLNIRWRLTLWNAVAVAAILVGFSALVYGLLARSLHQRIDQMLLSESQEIDGAPIANLKHWLRETREHENLFCIVYDAQGAAYVRTDDLPPESVLPLSSFGAGTRRFGNVAVPVIGRQRFMTAPAQLGDKPFTVVLLASLTEVDNALGQLLWILVGAVPLCLVLVGGVAYLLARKALSPVAQIHRLTEEITAERLDHRLPVGNTQDELGRLSRTVNAMIGRLERSFAEIRRFTADASHELRTPLTIIRTETEVALRQTLSPTEYQNLLGSILEECEHLTRLTDQLLTLSREDAAATKPVHEPVELGALLENVVDNMRPLAESKELRLDATTKGRARVFGDEGRLRQVFYNLLDNAIKYTPERGTVAVELLRQDQRAVVTVRDSGIGIPSEHLPRVFDRFYRVDKARSREQGGTGLGLSIARAIVVAHGGEIDLVSSPGQGTTCTVTLPVDGD